MSHTSEKNKPMMRDEILNMPAGLEIRNLIAEHVMDWEPWADSHFVAWERETIYCTHIGHPVSLQVFGDLPALWRPQSYADFETFYPDDTIADACLVIDTILDKQDIWEVELSTSTSAGKRKWRCDFIELGRHLVAVFDCSLPLAICHAALLVVMEHSDTQRRSGR